MYIRTYTYIIFKSIYIVHIYKLYIHICMNMYIHRSRFLTHLQPGCGHGDRRVSGEWKRTQTARAGKHQRLARRAEELDPHLLCGATGAATTTTPAAGSDFRATPLTASPPTPTPAGLGWRLRGAISAF